MFALVLIVLIPVIGNILFGRKVYAFLASAPLGVLVLWANMVLIEARAPDSDFDLIFGLACVFWAVVLTCGYGMLCVVFALLRSQKNRVLTGKQTRDVQARSG